MVQKNNVQKKKIWNTSTQLEKMSWDTQLNVRCFKPPWYNSYKYIFRDEPRTVSENSTASLFLVWIISRFEKTINEHILACMLFAVSHDVFYTFWDSNSGHGGLKAELFDQLSLLGKSFLDLVHPRFWKRKEKTQLYIQPFLSVTVQYSFRTT